MRPLPLFACLLLAAVGGGVTARWMTQHPTEPPAAQATAALVDEVATAALPPPALAALPAQIGGSPLPSLAPMLERVTPAVVNIYTKQVVRMRPSLISEMMGFPRQRVQQSLGSGVIVDATRGLILTNNHVVEGADQVAVTLSDGRTFEAKPIGFDADTDVAVIQIDASGLQALPLADSGSLRVGDFVVAVGNPYGLGQAVTSGIVSAVGRSGLTGLGYQNFIQTDASINPGNSGGALVNLRGELVGINSASYNPQGSAAGNIGLGFAIPSNLAREVMRQLMAYGEVRRGSLGLASQNPDEGRGAQVTRVLRGSPAEAAGIAPGDVIVAANGEPIASAEGLHNLEGLLPVGKPVRLELLRDGVRRTVSAVLKAAPKDIDGATLDARLAGATFTDVPERARQQGVRAVVVASVAAGSRAERNGLLSGDLVEGINGRASADMTEFRALLGTRPATLVLYVQRPKAGKRGQLEMR